MGIDFLNHAMSKDGDLGTIAFQSASQTYVGGQPFGLGASGIVFGTDVIDSTYQGVFVNSSVEDTNIGTQVHTTSTTTLGSAKPSVYWAKAAGSKVKMWKKVRHDYAESAPPFETSVTWAQWDKLYISSNGKWTNVTGSNRNTEHGVVLKAPASADDTLIAILY